MVGFMHLILDFFFGVGFVRFVAFLFRDFLRRGDFRLGERFFFFDGESFFLLFGDTFFLSILFLELFVAVSFDFLLGDGAFRLFLLDLECLFNFEDFFGDFVRASLDVTFFLFFGVLFDDRLLCPCVFSCFFLFTTLLIFNCCKRSLLAFTLLLIVSFLSFLNIFFQFF
jgi:hypothetical protein